MARTRRRLTKAEAEPSAAPAVAAVPLAMLAKAQAVGEKVRRLKRDAAGAHRLTHEAQVREALTRTELTLALHESLAARVELEARLREQALAAFRARARGKLRRHNRPSRMLDQALA